MKRKRRVLVISNYQSDDQQSMLRFATMLVSIYSLDCSVVQMAPPCLLGSLSFLPLGFCKYLSYIDKLLLFPVVLAIRGHNFDLVHIADQGNAFYSLCFPRHKCFVTCHDLLAMRAAFGDTSISCTTSPVGILLQWLIKVGLHRAGAVACDSQSTFLDFQRLIGSPFLQRQAVIPIPLNSSFCPEFDAFPLTLDEEALLPKSAYLLMVGSDHPRKNRSMALRLLEYLGSDFPYILVIAGSPLAMTEQIFRRSHPLGERLISIVRPSHALLNRLYCQAHVLLFPSFAEGFGWPLLEAQACRCPVIASNTTSIPEVAGVGALYAEPTDVATFASFVRLLDDPVKRSDLIERGITNSHRYDFEVISDAYRKFAFQL